MDLATRHRRPRLPESIASYDTQPSAYAERFAGLDTSEYMEWLAAALPGTGERRVLDLGCGGGRDTELLRARGLRTVGLDLSRSMVRHARREMPDQAFLVGDAISLPIRSNSLDGVWAMASLVHLDTAETMRALRELSRVLRGDGAVFVSVPWGLKSEWRPDGAGGRRWFRYFRSVDEVDELLCAARFMVRRIEDRDGIAAGRWINALALRSSDSAEQA